MCHQAEDPGVIEVISGHQAINEAFQQVVNVAPRIGDPEDYLQFELALGDLRRLQQQRQITQVLPVLRCLVSHPREKPIC